MEACGWARKLPSFPFGSVCDGKVNDEGLKPQHRDICAGRTTENLRSPLKL